ncbi:hypothetical protein ACHHYP_11381 [Achlya hypogyna]|uniref:Apple domain-containing protein n=1 Tax=Achlya hypogyna TaxID=1202772 RepID=A0A1V9YJ62_ACHHY|nr:hypothetical protein ACHHYP_11381 [Achlya hypogyna]
MRYFVPLTAVLLASVLGYTSDKCTLASTGKDYTGSDIMSVPVTGTSQAKVDTCCSTCSVTPGCVGWTVSANTCRLMSNMIESVADSNIIAAGSYKSPYTSATCSTIQKGMDYYGNSINKVQVSGSEQDKVDACCKACSNQISCVGWVIDGGDCRLKNKMVLSGSSWRIIAGFNPPPLKITSCSCSNLEQDVHYFGNTIRSIDVAGSPQEQTDKCCSACSTTSGCVGFVTRFNTCHLKSSIFRGGWTALGTIAGTYNAPHNLRECKIISTGKDYTGSDIKSVPVTGTSQAKVDTCCSTCSVTPGCVGWTVRANTCRLMSNMIESVADSNIIAAGSYKSPYTSATCSTIQKGMDYYGNDIKLVQVSGSEQDNVDACCKACSNQISCVGWVIDGGDCWLKNRMVLSGSSSRIIAGFNPPPPKISSDTCGNLEQDVDYSGDDIKSIDVTGSPQEQTDQCCSACSTTSGRYSIRHNRMHHSAHLEAMRNH